MKWCTKPLALILMFCLGAAHAAGAVDPTTLDNKVMIGYQGWFTCPEDGSQRWTHWSRGIPTADTLTVELYPDVSELGPDERCTIPGMTIGGKPACGTINSTCPWRFRVSPGAI
jgi:hypothetical protein